MFRLHSLGSVLTNTNHHLTAFSSRKRSNVFHRPFINNGIQQYDPHTLVRTYIDLVCMLTHTIIQYNTMQLIFDIALLPRTRQAQKCSFTSRRRRCNCNARHCGRGTCSRSSMSSFRSVRPICDVSVLCL